jgi:hypothetical protein
MSKLRFQVIPVIISGSHLVSGGGVLTLSNAGANFIQSRHFMSKIVVEKSQKL